MVFIIIPVFTVNHNTIKGNAVRVFSLYPDRIFREAAAEHALGAVRPLGAMVGAVCNHRLRVGQFLSSGDRGWRPQGARHRRCTRPPR